MALASHSSYVDDSFVFNGRIWSCGVSTRIEEGKVSRGIIGTIIGVLVIVILLILILQMT